jgi:hypothetical protein
MTNIKVPTFIAELIELIFSLNRSKWEQRTDGIYIGPAFKDQSHTTNLLVV